MKILRHADLNVTMEVSQASSDATRAALRRVPRWSTAAANLGAGRLGPKGSLYHRGWFDGQMDLVHALRERRITLRSAAISLGVRAPSELPHEEAGL